MALRYLIAEIKRVALLHHRPVLLLATRHRKRVHHAVQHGDHGGGRGHFRRQLALVDTYEFFQLGLLAWWLAHLLQLYVRDVVSPYCLRTGYLLRAPHQLLFDVLAEISHLRHLDVVAGDNGVRADEARVHAHHHHIVHRVVELDFAGYLCPQAWVGVAVADQDSTASYIDT